MDKLIRLIDLPPTINGLITIDADGCYNIYINARLSAEEQRRALAHELAHAKENHLFSTMTAQEAENTLVTKISKGKQVNTRPKNKCQKKRQISALWRVAKMAYYEKRSGVWSVVFMENGKRRRMSGRWHTKKEAQAAYTEYEAAKVNAQFNALLQLNKPHPDMTFLQVYDAFIAYMRTRWKPSTLYDFESKFKARVLPYFIKFRWDEITPAVMQTWQASLAQWKHHYQKDLYGFFVQVSRYAAETFGLEDISKKIKPPRNTDAVHEMAIWTPEQFVQFCNEETSAEYKLFFRLLWFTGCRLGEAQALTPGDFSQEKNELRISKTIITRGTPEPYLVSSPKNKYSIRNVAIPDELAQDLALWIQDHPGRFIFGGDSPLPQNSVRNHLKAATKRANLPPIRVHDIRHSHASYLLHKGVSIMAISRRLGHVNPNITLSTYSHLLPEDNAQIMRALSE